MKLAMFPLGTVLLPGCLLPLNVFEPRYLEMFASLENDLQIFGVTLIERGSEVGGGDVRFTVGTVGRVLMRRELEDGRLAVVAGGTNRFRVLEWHEDSPYPLATVTEFADIDDIDSADVDGIVPLVTRVNSMATELRSLSRPIDPDMQGGPSVRLFHLIESSPLGVLYRQRLLESASASVRLRLFRDLLEDAERVMLMNLDGFDG
jgi:Lon protease-like protein